MPAASVLSISLILFCMTNDVESVINGLRAESGEFPYMATLYKNKLGHLCGAAVIGSRYALTAAHCVHGEKASQWILKMGMIDWTDRNAEIFMVYKFHIQPDFEPKVVRQLTEQEKSEALALGIKLLSDVVMVRGPRHDIAIVETRQEFEHDLLALPLPRNEELREDVEDLRIAIIKLAEKRPETCAICILAGWGNTAEDTKRPTASHRLMFLMIKIHNIDDCCREDCDPITGMICAQHPARNTAPSFGDSGGPLICDGHLAGVLSNGDSYLNGAALYSDVAWYKDWIDSIIKEKRPSVPDNN